MENHNTTTDIQARFLEALEQQDELQAQLEVSPEAYQQAIETLLPVALSNSGQSEPVANLLLSLHNSYDFHFPLADLGRLDLNLIHHALAAIRGRVLLGIEPHEMIPKGQSRLDFLGAEYAHLHVDRRYDKNGR